MTIPTADAMASLERKIQEAREQISNEHGSTKAALADEIGKYDILQARREIPGYHMLPRAFSEADIKMKAFEEGVKKMDLAKKKDRINELEIAIHSLQQANNEAKEQKRQSDEQAAKAEAALQQSLARLTAKQMELRQFLTGIHDEWDLLQDGLEHLKNKTNNAKFLSGIQPPKNSSVRVYFVPLPQRELPELYIEHSAQDDTNSLCTLLTMSILKFKYMTEVHEDYHSTSTYQRLKQQCITGDSASTSNDIKLYKLPTGLVGKTDLYAVTVLVKNNHLEDFRAYHQSNNKTDPILAKFKGAGLRCQTDEKTYRDWHDGLIASAIKSAISPIPRSGTQIDTKHSAPHASGDGGNEENEEVEEVEDPKQIKKREEEPTTFRKLAPFAIGAAAALAVAGQGTLYLREKYKSSQPRDSDSDPAPVPKQP